MNNILKPFHTLLSKAYPAFMAVFLLSACSNQMEELPDTDDKEYDKERAFGVTFYISESGDTKAMLYSDVFERYQERNINYIDFLDSVYVEFYNNQLEVENVLTAEKARYYPETGDIIANHNIRVITKENDTLYTEELVYNEKLEKVYTTTPVEIHNGPQVTTGDYLEAKKDFSWVRIYKQKGTIPVDDTELMDDEDEAE